MNITSGYHSGLKKQYGGDRVINKEITTHSPENGGLDCMMRAEESGHDGTTYLPWYTIISKLVLNSLPSGYFSRGLSCLDGSH